MEFLKTGFCGDDCNYCPRYLATRDGNEARLKEVADMWQMLGWRSMEESWQDITCYGCSAVQACILGIKDCVVEKGIDSCGKCHKYPCEKLVKKFESYKKNAEISREKFMDADFRLFQKAFFTIKERLDKIHEDHFQGMKDHVRIEVAAVEDAIEILNLQKLAYLSEAEIYNDYSIAPLTQTLDEIRIDFSRQLFLKASLDVVIVGSVRGYLAGETCYIGRLIVHPDYQNSGIGTRLMHEIEARYSGAKRYELFTGHRSVRNLHLYRMLGYRQYASESHSDNLTIVYLEKLNED